jgi:hypothetical protein
MQKKSSTPRTRTATPSRLELRRQLARDLASVMSNPETPSNLYNAIADEVCMFSEKIDFHTAEMLERGVNAYYAKEEKRKGGAR